MVLVSRRRSDRNPAGDPRAAVTGRLYCASGLRALSRARTTAPQRSGYGAEFDLATYFLHDVLPEIIKQGEAHQRPEANIVFGEPYRFQAWRLHERR